MTRKAKQLEGEPAVPETAWPAYDAIVALTNARCAAGRIAGWPHGTGNKRWTRQQKEL